jgi:Metallo-beta-lactamase superfamily
MKFDWRLASIFVVCVSLPQGARAQSAPLDQVKQAVQAEGGAEALRNLKRVAIAADAKHWEPEQSYKPGGDPRLLASSKLTINWDLENGKARTEWDRSLIYPSVGNDKYTDVLTPKSGFIVTSKGERPMSSIRVSSEQRELMRNSPTFLLKALASPEHLGAMADQPLGTDRLPAVAFDDGPTKFIILFDRGTHLPAAIRTLDDDSLLGDANYDVVFSEWKPVAGALVAHTLTQRLAGTEVGKVVYANVTANPALDAKLFEPSEKLSGDLKPPATGNVPYQWVLRRINLGRFTDSDAVNYDAASSPGLKLVEIAPNVQHAVGGTHNTLIVAMPTFLVIFDAPINEWQSRWTIDAVKQKYPGKPIKYLVLTHQHNDHTGGARTYVAEGATVIVGAPGRAYFEKVFAAPHTVNPDQLQKNPKTASVMEFADQMSIKDGDDEIRLYKIASSHSDPMVIGQVVRSNVVWVTDLYSPTRDKAKNEWMTEFDQALKKYSIKPTVIAGGHGGSGPAGELEGLMSQK